MKWLFIAAVVAVVSAAAWMFSNPLNGFGVSCWGLTTFEMIPIPLADVEVRADGNVHLAGKPGQLGLDDVRPLLEPKPEALIITTGWRGRLQVSPDVSSFLQGYDVQVVKTGEGLDLYNRLVAQGKKTAIRVRSTS
jgi:hypothetical protein